MSLRLPFWCFLLVSILLAACVPIQPAPVGAGEAPAPGMEQTVYVIELSDEGIQVPDNLASGLVAIEVRNTGSDVHAAILRRLNDGVSLEEFEAAFAENAFATLPLTTQLGGPDVNAGESSLGYFPLEPGVHVVVDNTFGPPIFAAFTVTEDPAPEVAEPLADVSVRMTEYAFDLPATIPAGELLWGFENAGSANHQMGIVRMNEGATLEDVATWLDNDVEPPPFEWITFWNVMSGGVQSWGTITLEPGTYMLLDFLPNPADDVFANLLEGMAFELTVE